ncbi:acid-sensing ion channel 1C-like [Acanthaster planci]|uniref:Acid-sensing ion channel 1C-like n=1 Tax=Acanthaster planci TaxID=133434 RepID=A0A8B7ZE10_ACAPL|nr:acid-sensing ion channel 1C-like [Acanthaster planci]
MDPRVIIETTPRNGFNERRVMGKDNLDELNIIKNDRNRHTQDDDANRTFAERFQDFGNSTTLHGISYVINLNYKKQRRLLWLLLVLVMSIWLVYSIVEAFITYFNYPMTSAISIHYMDTLTFPAVTLCNFNQFRRSALTPGQVMVMNEVYGPNPPESIDFGPFNEITNYDFSEDHLANISHYLDRMLVKCKWRGTQPCTGQNFTRRFTDHGVCFTFNDPKDASHRLEVSNAGRLDGLFLRLFAETDEYTFGENSAAGFRILLHPQGLMPLVKELGISVSPGFESSISIRQNVFKSLPWPFESNCTSSKSKNSTTYSVPTCKYECKVQYVVERCGCRDYRWTGSAPLCPPEQHFNCIDKYKAEYQKQEKYRDCHCPVSCELKTYDSRVSFGYWPSSYVSENLPLNSTSEEYIRKNYLDVYIFFEELVYLQIEQKSAYDFAALQSGVGGNMGLLCGMSLITVVEWADFIVISLLRKFKARRI